MEKEKQRTIQEYIPGKQVTLAHLIANPDKDMCVKLGLDEEKGLEVIRESLLINENEYFYR